MDQQGVEILSADEIAFLYRRPPGRVKKALDEALLKLRATAIEQQLPRQFRVVETDRACCVCESAVDDVPRSLRLERHVYCSRDCRDHTPPPLVALEISRGLPIAKILEWTFHHYRTLPLAEQALGIPRWLLQDAATRHLGRALDSFFEKRERKTLVRRTWHAPEWVDALITRTRVKTKGVTRFGPLTVDLQGFRKELADLLM